MKRVPGTVGSYSYTQTDGHSNDRDARKCDSDWKEILLLEDPECT